MKSNHTLVVKETQIFRPTFASNKYSPALALAP